MTNPQSVLLGLLSRALFGGETELPETDWEGVLSEASAQTVIALAHSAIPKDLLSGDEAARWEQKAVAAVGNSIRVTCQHEALHTWLTESEIPYVVLKGCSSAHYYPEPLLRAMGDVDFLVPKECLPAAGALLGKNGFEAWKEEHGTHIVYRRSGVSYEMHFDLPGMPKGRPGKVIRTYFSDIYEKAVTVKADQGEVILPSLFHHGLILLLHSCHHLTGEGIGLRHLCDWAVFESSLSEEAFRETFEEKLRAVGLWTFARVLTRVCIRYLAAPERAWATCDAALADALAEDILFGGNFGKKDSARAMESHLISDRGKSGVGKTGMGTQFFRSVNEVIRSQWAPARRHGILLPAGWVYFGCRRLFREWTGKRTKTEIGRTLKDASRRRDLYRELKLYEGEEE